MGPELSTKVRLVRCPKCRQLLPELPDVPVYRCGGCSAILQAKSRINGLRSKSSSLNETVANQKNIGLESSSSSRKALLRDERNQYKSLEGKESSSSSDKPSFPDSGECFSDQNNEKNADKSSDDKESSSSSHDAALPDAREISSDQNNERIQSKSSEGNKSSSASTPKATSPDSGECFSDQNNVKSNDMFPKDKESSSSSHSASLSDSGEISLDQNNDRDQSKSSEGNKSSSASTPKATFPDSGECFLDQNNVKSNDMFSKDKESSSSSHSASLSDSGEISSNQKYDRDQRKSSEGNESSNPSPKVTLPNLGECFPDQNNERHHSKSSEGSESSSSSPKATFPDSGERSLDKNNKKSPNKTSEDEEFGNPNHKATLPDTEECISKQTNGSDPGRSSEDCNRKQLGDMNLSSENQINQSDQNDSCDCESEQLEVPNDICPSIEFAHNEIKQSLPITGAGSAASEHDESCPLTKSNEDIGIYKEIDSDFRSSRAVIPGDTRRSTSIVSAHIPARESISLDSLVSSPNEPLEEPQYSFRNVFGHVRSPNTFEDTEFNPSSEFRGARRDMSKSPANRSHHAYDGSVSSYEGMDDQFFNGNVHSNFVHSEGRPRRDKFLVNKSMMDRDLGFLHQPRDSWSSMSDKNDHAMKYRRWDQDELLQARRQGHPSRDWNSFQRDEYMSRMALPRRVSHGGYDNGRPTRQLHKEYQRNSGPDTEQDKMTLLRMVYELQDQVNNMNGKASGRVAGGATWKEKRIPQYPSYEASEQELFHDPNYQRYLRSRRAGNYYPPQHRKAMRIPFSSEATTSRHQVDPSYLHRGPLDWQCSAPLPVPIRCSNNGLCRVHPGHNCWTPLDISCATSPEQYVESDSSLWGRETISDDLRHKRHDMKKYFTEKNHVAKRHFRPIAGGAPIIICYNCLKPLQIPADFLLFKRKCHRLRCGACLEVLKFSIQKKCHILPYEQSSIDPPPSEVGDYNFAVNGSNLASAPQPFDSHHADPVSCSDDYGYGIAYSKSYSSEGDPGTLAPSNSPLRNSDETKELGLTESQNKDKSPVEAYVSYVSARPSLSSEIQEVLPKSTSPLHRLMGYASPSQVIRGSGSSHVGTSSYATRR